MDNGFEIHNPFGPSGYSSKVSFLFWAASFTYPHIFPSLGMCLPPPRQKILATPLGISIGLQYPTSYLMVIHFDMVSRRTQQSFEISIISYQNVLPSNGKLGIRNLLTSTSSLALALMVLEL